MLRVCAASNTSKGPQSATDVLVNLCFEPRVQVRWLVAGIILVMMHFFTKVNTVADATQGLVRSLSELGHGQVPLCKGLTVTKCSYLLGSVRDLLGK